MAKILQTGTMHDLIVVGAGFWGTAIARYAARLGMDALVLDARERLASSPAAAGIVCWHWYDGDLAESMMPDWWSPLYLRSGREYVEGLGLRATGEVFSKYNDYGTRKYREDCSILPDLSDALHRAPFHVRVERVERTESGWVVDSEGPFENHAKHVVIAAGAWTDALLAASGLPPVGVRPLLGRAVLASPAANAEPLTVPRTHMPRPFGHLTLRPWQHGLVRLGDLVERGNKALPANTERLLEVLEALSPGARPFRWPAGLRPVAKKYIVEEVAPGLVVATGGHRVGLALSGAVAKRTMELLYGNQE